MRIQRRFYLVAGVLVGTSATLCAGYVPINLSGLANTGWTTFPSDGGGYTVLLGGASMPKGSWTDKTGTIPFSTPTGENNVWSADAAAHGQLDAGLESVTVPVGLYGVSNVYTVINSEWGQPNLTFASLTFTGSSSTYTFNLVGGVDIRDYNNANWVNQASTTVNVWEQGNQRLDMQAIPLPSSFLTQTLLSVTLQDWGDRVNILNPSDNLDAQRTFLAALTVGVGNAVPEPGTGLLLLGGLGALAVARRRRGQVDDREESAGGD